MAQKKEGVRVDTSVLPNSVEAEQSILCCIMRDPIYQLDIISELAVDDFYQINHKKIFSAMDELARNSVTVDFATLIDRLRRSGQLAEAGNVDYLTKLNDLLPSTARFLEYLKIVKRASLMRKLIAVCGKITELCYTEADEEKVISFAEQVIFDLTQKNGSRELLDLSRIATKTLLDISRRYMSPESFHGLKSGYFRLDSITNGFRGSELIIIAARPAVGKSALAMNMVENMARDGHTIAVFSLEMSNEQLMERLLSTVSGVPLSEVKSGKLKNGEADLSKLSNATELITSKMHIFGNDNPNIRVAEIRSQCRRLKLQGKLDCVVIDYIGLMEDDDLQGGNRQNQVARISRGLKIMAKELNIPVIALCQLKREAEIRNLNARDKNLAESAPVLSDLRESGAIEQDADLVMFIHREETENGEKHSLVIAKNRNGERGIIPLYWNGSCVHFIDEQMLQKYMQTATLTPPETESVEEIPEDLEHAQFEAGNLDLGEEK